VFRVVPLQVFVVGKYHFSMRFAYRVYFFTHGPLQVNRAFSVAQRINL